MTLDEGSEKDKDKYKPETTLKDLSHPQREKKRTQIHTYPWFFMGRTFSIHYQVPKTHLHYFSKYSHSC